MGTQIIKKLIMESLFSTGKEGQRSSSNSDSIMSAYEAEMAIREQQNIVYCVANNPHLPDSEKQHMYESIVNKSSRLSGHKYVAYLMEQQYPGDVGGRNVFVPCPQDIHKGPFMFEEDRYTVIYGYEADKNISGNCNNELIKTVNGTEVTQGMLNRSKGERWCNGLIAFNKNSIVVRDDDNNFGQPGFNNYVTYCDRLSVEIMNRYVVSELIRKANRFEFTSKTSSSEVRSIITKTFERVYREKMAMIEGCEVAHLNETVLFRDEPVREEISKPLDAKEIKIYELEKKVAYLSEKFNAMAEKFAELEEMYLDMSIKVNKERPDQTISIKDIAQDDLNTE
ncbi:hypothetical protein YASMINEVIRUS_962 [Yasminevirus sp. GU-2018]|uniref:Uncharacterized protein n=1 Tax=Yasminevirus sp. GU-2018 TaxID=2420051 RepID=A0A5K0U8M4_9VIRU|nr:hypothetical protein YASMINEVIRUS_962 [Yasminevirus sp. GU-2018]